MKCRDVRDVLADENLHQLQHGSPTIAAIFIRQHKFQSISLTTMRRILPVTCNIVFMSYQLIHRLPTFSTYTSNIQLTTKLCSIQSNHRENVTETYSKFDLVTHFSTFAPFCTILLNIQLHNAKFTITNSSNNQLFEYECPMHV